MGRMVSVEEDDLAGLEDVSSDGEDDNYEAELTDNETPSLGAAAVRRPYRKKNRDPLENIPLMEGEGRSLRVLGFNQSQRAVFVQILMRFGIGELDWAEFVPRLKQKTFEEIHEYGQLFMLHICEDINDSPTFSDNVPKEGLRIDDVLVRIGTLSLVRDKLKALSEGLPTLFKDDIISRYPGLKGGRLWKEHHDQLLLRAVMKHGYGRWQAIVDDKDLRIQEVICQELNLPFINAPAHGTPQVQNVSSGTSNQQFPFSGTSHTQNGVKEEHAEAPGNERKGPTAAADVGHGTTETAARPQTLQDQSMLYHFREMQRRLVEFVKKRVLLLEKGLNAELQKVHYADDVKATNIENPCSEAVDSKMTDQLPQVEIISPSEITTFACDKSQERLDMARLFNEMSRIVIDNVPDSAEAYYEPANLTLRKNIGPLKDITEEISQTISVVQQVSGPQDKLVAPTVEDHNAEAVNLGSSPATVTRDYTVLGAAAMDIDNPDSGTNNNVGGDHAAAESLRNGSANIEVEMKQENPSQNHN